MDCAWRIRGPGKRDRIEGWADRVSVLPGERVRLAVSTVAVRYVVRAYRMGWYGGHLGCLVAVTPPQPGVHQPPARLVAGTRTVESAWRTTTSLDTSGWPPGDYLLRLDADGGGERYIPLTVRGTAASAVVLVNAVTTWQAYNDWGGYTLYHGPGGRADFPGRSRAVSFDRPYAGDGAGEFVGRELPLIALADRLRLPLDYVTDVDLDRLPTLLNGARAVVSLGHDEYWSARMRDAVTRARDAGSNLAFLGANAVFRRIRLGPTAIGPDRLEVNYKVPAEDPLDHVHDSLITGDWPFPPAADPESSLTGVMYDCFPARGDLVVVDPGSWLFAGTGVRSGQRLVGVIGPESDRVNLSWPTPRPIEVLTHSMLNCKGRPTFADSAYYTVPSGAGVFASGTINWDCAISRFCSHAPDAGSDRIVQRVTENLLRAFAAGPAGRAHPAVDNLTRLRIGRSAGPY